MIVIQCRENMFNLIQTIMSPQIPQIVEEAGGYRDCFERDWIFIVLNDEDMEDDKYLEIFSLINARDYQFVFAFDSDNSPRIFQQNLSEVEQCVFIRFDSATEKYEIRHGFKSYIRFVSERSEETLEETE